MPPKTPFVRTGTTWLAYFMLGYYAFLPTMISPAMPFLRAEFNLSYTVAALHMSAFSLGIIFAGLTGDRLARWLGRRRLLWFAAAWIAVFGLLFIFSSRVELTILSSLCMAAVGANIQVMVQAVLSDQYGEQRAVALSEANVAASIASTLAPFLVSSFQRIQAGWRAALAAGIASFFLMALFFHKAAVIEVQTNQAASPSAHARHLPRAYWFYWFATCMVVSIEWCLIFWCPDFLEKVVKLSRIDAVTVMSLFYLANVLGRLFGSRLASRYSVQGLLIAALVVSMAGFLLFWSALGPVISVAGLFIAGVGVANLFPYTMTAAVGAAASAVNLASARISLAVGLSILLAPLTLGWISDQAGIRAAYSMVPVLIVLAATLVLAGSSTPLPSISPQKSA